MVATSPFRRGVVRGARLGASLLSADPTDGDDRDLDPDGDLDDDVTADTREMRSLAFVSSLGPNVTDYQQWLLPGGRLSLAPDLDLQRAAAQAGLPTSQDLVALKMLMENPDAFGALGTRMRARYTRGKCPVCHKGIEQGQWIDYAQNHATRHWECGVQSVREASLKPKIPTKPTAFG
jgi:hypothetical protein